MRNVLAHRNENVYAGIETLAHKYAAHHGSEHERRYAYVVAVDELATLVRDAGGEP